MDCRSIPDISNAHGIEIAAPFKILTKRYYFSDKTLIHHFFTYPVAKNKVIQKDFQGTEGQQLTPEVRKYYVAEYDGSLFPGIVAQIHCGKSVQVNCLQKATKPAGSTSKWPDKKHEIAYPLSDVKFQINVSKLLPGSARNIVFEVPELNDIWGK